MIICTFDDRSTDIIGLQLLVASLSRFVPQAPVYVACPAADALFEAWLARYPNVQFDKAERFRGKGWDVKPLLLKELLNAGHDEVIWMDSDIIVTGDFLKYLPNDRALVIAEEPAVTPYGLMQRVTGWKLQQGRSIRGINSCLIRANSSHALLIERWLELLRHPDYQNARTLPFEKRLPHLLTDQDVLLALMASTEFSDLPVHYLSAGRQIVQSHGMAGYSPLQRIRNLFTGVPCLVHSQGDKPWRARKPRSIVNPGEFFLQLHLETAPYAHFARGYRNAIEPFPTYLELRSLAARVSNLAAFGNPCLRGLSLAMAAAIARRCRRMAGIASRAAGRARRLWRHGHAASDGT